MRYRALAVAALCRAAHGKRVREGNRRNQKTSEGPFGGNDKEDAAAPSRAMCRDGEDCTPTACAAAAHAGAGEAACEGGAIADATNPRGRNLQAVPMAPFCVEFNDAPDTEGFAPCPGAYDNIDVAHSTNIASWTDDPNNSLTGDNYLWLRDGSGGSLACGTGAAYVGDWTALVAAPGCRDLCFDVRLIHDGCHSGMVPPCSPSADGSGFFIDVLPALILQGGPPTHYRAVFRATANMTDDDGSSHGWHRICAPLAPLSDAGELPSNDVGHWYMAAPNDVLSGASPTPGPPSPDSAWPALLSDIAAIQLPIDFTGNPAERVGYDSICIQDRDCGGDDPSAPGDPCDPQPLCYWQHEWDCKDATKEEWYANFTVLAASTQTLPEKPCLCKILDQCCPDRCDMAEQELAALLLNVAAGHLALDCPVNWCGDCVHDVSSILSRVDGLLAPSSRSDYDCSVALHLLTGINDDSILCDCPPTDECRYKRGQCVKDCVEGDGVKCEDICDPNSTDPDKCLCELRDDPGPCPQTDECKDNRGRCVPAGSCVPSPAVACEDHFCGDGTGEECTCKMAVPCRQTTDCHSKGGQCLKNCVESPGVKCEDICDPNSTVQNKCLCELRDDPGPCPQTEECNDKDGRCVPVGFCVPSPTVACEDDLCGDATYEGCTCRMPVHCPQTDSCLEYGGRCTKNCVEGGGVTCKDVCLRSNSDSPDNCMCEVRVTVQPSTKPTASPTATPTTSPTAWKPTVTPTSKPTATPTTHPTAASTACEQTDACLSKEGRCLKNCVEGDGVKCEDLCDPDSDAQDKCLCELRVDPGPCPQTDECAQKQGVCVPSELCFPSATVACEGILCGDVAGEECMCRMAVRRYHVACGRYGNCGADNDQEADPTNDYPVRCCSETVRGGWKKRPGCDVWAKSLCHSLSYDAAAQLCADNGGRLCTIQELSDDCSRGTGCSFDGQMVWSDSSAGSSSDVLG